MILAPTLANNSFGTIITKGRFQGINTVAFTQGDSLYVSPTVAGDLTNVRPDSPYYDVKIGTVITSSANGIVDLTPQPYVPPPDEDVHAVLISRAFATSIATSPVIGPVFTRGYTVATLPAGLLGMHAHVTDATVPTYNAALVGGGAVAVPVFYNGAAWVSA